ncbi:transcriptional regulator [Burkholderia cenocepacia]|uniref:helix-turn-helix transcriptional regulator n=1 Tax=Burkholderia cenocepacia TaxID=95486 RepID=UPI0023B94FB9|nr:transcriptional regulator [Burkholderia cenocepacia]MDF0500852.1 transcriptional regulator [Burkholderia cenocepacia]
MSARVADKKGGVVGAGPAQPALPAVGLSKWSQIQPFIPLCRESWRKLVLAGKAPQPIRLSSACTVYRNEDVHRWLADPLGYAAASQEQREAA